MTRPHSARNRQGWLTAHALASGLREQFAHEMNGESRQVQLRCIPRPAPRTFIVEYTVDQVTQTWTFTDLRLAQARYTALVHKAQRPKEGGSA